MSPIRRWWSPTSADRVQTEALVTAGVELAAFQLAGVSEAVRPTSGTFNARVGGGRVIVTFRSEAARVDLNAAPKGLLAGLIDRARRQPGECGTLCRAHHRLALADRSRRQRSGKFVLPDLGRTLSAAPCAIPAGRRTLAGAGHPAAGDRKDAAVRHGVLNVASVNVRDAAPQVLAALPGMYAGEVCRRCWRSAAIPTLDPRSLMSIAGGEGATLAGSKAYRISLGVEFGSVSRNAAEVVILLLDSGEAPYRVLSWRNVSDGATAPQRAASR